jgi:hypothetical protein
MEGDTMTKMTTMDARETIAHICDGPLTPFVLISRAVELAGGKQSPDDPVANALYDALKDAGWLRDGMIYTGT